MQLLPTFIAVLLLSSLVIGCNNQVEQNSAPAHTQTTAIETDKAPKLTGLPISQGLRSGNLIFLSGQLGFVPETMQLDNASFETEAHRTFMNLQAVAQAGGGDLSDVVKLTVYLTDLNNFDIMNKVMKQYFQSPYPTRTTLQVSALARGAAIEVEGIMVLSEK